MIPMWLARHAVYDQLSSSCTARVSFSFPGNSHWARSLSQADSAVVPTCSAVGFACSAFAAAMPAAAITLHAQALIVVTVVELLPVPIVRELTPCPWQQQRMRQGSRRASVGSLLAVCTSHQLQAASCAPAAAASTDGLNRRQPWQVQALTQGAPALPQRCPVVKVKCQAQRSSWS